MKSNILVGLFAASFAIACSSTTSSTSSGGSADASSGGTSSSGGSAARGKNGEKICPAPADAGANACTTAQEEEYSTCILGKCEAKYVDAVGPNYASGTFAGKCGTYFGCLDACACNDTACTTACGKSLTSDATCLTSLQELSACIEGGGCTKPCGK